MAKILKWGDISDTYVNRGTLTQCPSYNMVSSNIKSGYQIKSSSTTVPTQLLTEITFKLTTGILNIGCAVDVNTSADWASVGINIMNYTPVGASGSAPYIVASNPQNALNAPTLLTYEIPIGTTITVILVQAKVSTTSVGQFAQGKVTGVTVDGVSSGNTLGPTIEITGEHSIIVDVGKLGVGGLGGL